MSPAAVNIPAGTPSVPLLGRLASRFSCRYARAAMNTKLNTVLSGLLALSVGACSSSPGETLVDLTVEQEATIDFDDMAANVAEIAAFSVEDMRKQARYTELRPSLACAGLDLAASWLEITDVAYVAGSPASPVPLQLQLDISEPRATVGPDGELGTADDDLSRWVPLGELDAAVKELDVFTLSDAEWTAAPAGLALLATLALSDDPRYDVRVTGEVDDALASLMVDLHLEIDFSSRAGSCPAAP